MFISMLILVLMALFTEVKLVSCYVQLAFVHMFYLMNHDLWYCKHLFCRLIFTVMIRVWQFSSMQKVAGMAWLQSLLSCLVLERLTRRWNRPWWIYGQLVLTSLLWASTCRLTLYPQHLLNVDIMSSLLPVINIGNYLISQPTERHLTVREYVTPEKFQFWKEYGESVGFRYVASGPLVSVTCSWLHPLVLPSNWLLVIN